MQNIIIYQEELYYEKNREELFTLIPKYDNLNTYYIINIDNINLDDFENLVDILKYLNLDNHNIKSIFFYPRQTIKNNEIKIYQIISECAFRKLIYIDDLHKRDNNNIKNIINKFDYIFCSYPYLLDFFKMGFTENKIISIPHYLNDKYLYNNEEKNIKISILGHFARPPYKTRRYIFQEFYNINKYLKHCDISTYPPLLEIEKYYEILRQSYASIATTGDGDAGCYFPYIVSKYFEIPGSGSLLIAHVLPEMKLEMEKYGFIPYVNYIPFHNISELVNICNMIFYKNNFDEIEKIRLSGLKLVRENHLISNRIKEIIKYMNKE